MWLCAELITVRSLFQCLIYSVQAVTTICIEKSLCDTVGALSEKCLMLPSGRKGCFGDVKAEQTKHKQASTRRWNWLCRALHLRGSRLWVASYRKACSCHFSHPVVKQCSVKALWCTVSSSSFPDSLPSALSDFLSILLLHSLMISHCSVLLSPSPVLQLWHWLNKKVIPCGVVFTPEFYTLHQPLSISFLILCFCPYIKLRFVLKILTISYGRSWNMNSAIESFTKTSSELLGHEWVSLSSI